MAELPFVAPGEVLREALQERGMTQDSLARTMGRPAQAISEIVNGKKSITAKTAIQLERALGISARLWLHLDADYRLGVARRNDTSSAAERRQMACPMTHLPEMACDACGKPAEVSERG